MDKHNTIVIDLGKWTIPTSKAKSYIGRSGEPVSIEYICKLMKDGKLKSWKIEELGLHLVER